MWRDSLCSHGDALAREDFSSMLRRASRGTRDASWWRVELKTLNAVGRGPGGRHAMRRLLGRAWMVAERRGDSVARDVRRPLPRPADQPPQQQQPGSLRRIDELSGPTRTERPGGLTSPGTGRSGHPRGPAQPRDSAQRNPRNPPRPANQYKTIFSSVIALGQDPLSLQILCIEGTVLDARTLVRPHRPLAPAFFLDILNCLLLPS